MLRIKLLKYDAPSYKTEFIDFPAAENNLDEIMRERNIGITTDKNCMVEQISGDNGGLQSLIGKLINIDEVQFLAKRLDSLDTNELQTFYATVHSEKPATVAEMINLTFNTHCYTAVSDFSDIAAIGRRYELNRQGCMSTFELEHLDAITLGRMLIDSENGEVTPYGVLYRNGNNPDSVYNGEQFPQFSYRGDDVAMVTLEHGDYATGIKYEYLYLPCCDAEITKALNHLGVASIADCATHLDCSHINETVQEIFAENAPLCNHLNTLNELSRCYVEFSRKDIEAFHGIVELTNPQTPQDVLVLAGSYGDFFVVPNIQTAEEYGRYIIAQGDELRGKLGGCVMRYIDFKGFGDEVIAEENGSFTEFGYIGYQGDIPEVLALMSVNSQEQTQDLRM